MPGGPGPERIMGPPVDGLPVDEEAAMMAELEEEMLDSQDIN